MQIPYTDLLLLRIRPAWFSGRSTKMAYMFNIVTSSHFYFAPATPALPLMVAQRRQFEPAVDGVFWRTTVFFVLVLRQQDCVLQPCISPKSTIHGRRFLNCYFANAKAVEWVVAVATAIETNARIHKIAVIETGSNWRRWARTTLFLSTLEVLGCGYLYHTET